MLIVEFDADQFNYIVVGEEPYFLLETGERFMVTQDRCPHRGGPLHLGKWDCLTKSLACPWHGTCLMETALERRSVPSVRCGNRVAAMFPVDPETEYQCQNRMVIANDSPIAVGQ